MPKAAIQARREIDVMEINRGDARLQEEIEKAIRARAGVPG